MKRFLVYLTCIVLVGVAAYFLGVATGVVVEKHNERQRQIDTCLDAMMSEGISDGRFRNETFKLMKLLKEK